MDLRFLEDILVLLEERSLNRAAARRNITQPAFSRRVRSVEDWIGTQLLERKANKVEISPALSANEEEIKSLIKRVDRLKRRLVDFNPDEINVSVAIQHALIVSAFPDMVASARSHLPSLNFRLRAANYNECVSMFIRGDASILLRYEDHYTQKIGFDVSVERHVWGKDRLVPVVGGGLKYLKTQQETVPDDIPSIVYPQDSYFGRLLSMEGKEFSVMQVAKNPVLESAFSAGIKELVLAGLGIAWLPISMVYRELEAGELVGLNKALGFCDLSIAFYVKANDPVSMQIKTIWAEPTDHL